MKLSEIVEKLNLDLKTNTVNLDAEVESGYSSDLLSDVMANAREGAIWITLQIHHNIVAVAVLKSLAGIILVNNRDPDNDTLQKAVDEDIPVMTTGMSTFEVVGKLYELGISGK